MAQFSKDYFDKHRTYSYVTRPPEAFDAGRYMGIEKPGFIGSVLDNVAGGAAGMVGGLADTAGTFLKSGYEEGQLDELWGLLGKGLVDAGIDLNQYAGDRAARSGVLGKYEDMGLLDRATSLDYWTDPRGFTAESANAFGSMIPFMALAAAAPEVGASAGVSYLARAGLSRVGLKKAAELFSPRVAAMIGGNKVVTPGGAGREFLADFANWAGTGVFDAAANAGEVIAEARRKGETDTEMAERAKKAMYYELPYDMVSQGLFGGLIGGRGLRRAMEGKSLKRNIGANAVLGTAEAANEGTQEHFQTQAVEHALDKPVGTFFEPTEEERKAFNAAFMGTLPMVFAGGARNVAKNWVDGKIESMQSELKTARNPSAEEESAGEEERRVGSILDDAAPYIGVTMDNGTQGCVEAVTKVGAKSSPFLAQELENGVVNVDDLVAHAGNNVIPFDPDSLEEGDVIVYGDGSDPHLHVVLYDGKGGYIGNSTERNKVVQETDYTAMGTSENGQPIVPTKIIKTGAQFADTHAAPVMPDFTGLIADETTIKETQERIQHLIDTDGLTPEQHAAILEAAQMIRDMPVGDGTDPALEAEHVNEWQSLIDRKDVKGIFEKDPQRVVQTMTTLGKEQRAQKTRAAIENQQQIEETKQAINALRAQSIAQPVPTGRIDNTVQGLPGIGEAGASVGGNDLGGGYDAAQGGMLMNAPLPPADNVPTQQSVPGRTIGTAAANLPMRNNPAQIVEQGTGGGLLTPGLQAYETGQTGGANPLMNVPPAPAQTTAVRPDAAGQGAAYANAAGTPVQNETAMPMQSGAGVIRAARRPAPVVGVRPNVPTKLPDNLEERRKLGRSLGRFMMANGIPDSPSLRDDLAMGRGKAIRAANDKIGAWEEKRAEQEARAAKNGDVNTRYAAQEDAQETRNTPHDTTYTQKETGAENGSKSVREKSAQNEAENELPPGYRTESGRPLSEADPQEFIIKPNGSRNFGEIPQEIEDATGGKVKSAPIRLRVGTEDGGFVHLVKEHAAQMKQKGYGVMDYINHILQNFNQVYSQQTGERPHRFVLYCKGDESKGFMPIDLELEQTGENYYVIVSAMPHKAKIRGTLLFDGSANPSAVTTDDTLLEETNHNGGVGTSPNTHGKSKDPSTSTISSEAEESKENPLSENEREALKGFSADAKNVYRMVRDKLRSFKNKLVGRSSSVGAILLARHAEIIARKMRAITGQPFTAMDYYRLLFALQYGGNADGFAQALNAGVNLDEQVPVVDITAALPQQKMSNKDVLNFIRGLVQKNDTITSADGKAVFSILPKDVRHITFSSNKKASSKEFRIRKAGVLSIQDLLQNAVLVESTPNRKTGKKPNVRAYHRFYVPVRFGNDLKTLRIVAEEQNGAITLQPTDVNLYDIIVEQKAARTPAGISPVMGSANGLSTISIRDMLTGVKDADGNVYAQSAWHGSPYDFREFLLSMIGVGEGAQAHGWGLYFAQNRNVSERYKERLTQRGHKTLFTMSYDGKPVEEQSPSIQRAMQELSGAVHTMHGDGVADTISAYRNGHEKDLRLWQKHLEEFDRAIALYEGNSKVSLRTLRDSVPKYSNAGAAIDSSESPVHGKRRTAADAVRALKEKRKLYVAHVKEEEQAIRDLDAIDVDKIRIEVQEPVGKLFEVEIPDNDVLLDEQKPFDEQPQFVKEKLRELFGKESAEERLAHLEKIAKKDPKLYQLLTILHQTERNIKQFESDVSMLRDVLDVSKSPRERALIFWDIDELDYVDRSQLDDRHEDDVANIESSRPYLEKCLASYERALQRKKDGYQNTLNTLTRPEKMDGREIYQYLSARLGGDKAASLALNEVGIKGITYVGGRDGRCYVIFDDKAISIIEKFNQQMNAIIKGTTQDMKDGQRIISLLTAADESTFLHEMGHLFLLDLERLADMSPTSAEELQTVRKWAAWSEGQAAEYKGTPFEAEFADLDAKIRAALKKGDEKKADQLKRQWEHERFARGFERYLQYGEAPTKGLRSVFAKFRAFLQRVYQAFTGQGGRATPEVEAVMARMIAMEEEAVAENIERGKQAMQKCVDTQQDVPNAMKRSDVGVIDFVWGEAGKGAKFKQGKGIAHILAKHVPESGSELLDKIVETIAKGEVIQEKTAGGSTQSRLVLEHNGYVALLSMNDDSGAWLLSGWETYDSMKKRTSSASGEGDGSTVATATAPMRSRRDGEDALSSISNISSEKGESNKKDSPSAEDFARSADKSDGARSTVGGNLSSISNIPRTEAEGKQEPTLENILQLAPSLKKAALEYGAKDERGKVTFADEERKQEFLKVAKALLGAGERKTSARRQEALQEMLDGITIIPPHRVSPRKRVIADWGREMGVTVVFFKGDPSLHGFHQNGVTFLNVDSEITPQWTFWHEAMHWMKANNPDIYNDLVAAISDAEGFTKEQLDAYRREIGAPEMSDADVIEEMLADALPDVKRRVPLLRDIGKRDTGLVQRVVAWIRDVMRRFHDHFHTPKGGLTSAQRVAMTRAFGNLVGSIRDAEGKAIFRIENEGARITLRGGKPLPTVKYSLDNRGKEGDNEGGRNLGEARKEAICSNVLARMKTRVHEMLKQGIPFAEIQKELEDENSTSREEALRVFKTQWNIFNSPRVNKRNIVERITKREDFTDDEINELFEQYKSTMKEMLDYGGFIYKEAAFQQRGNREFLAGVHSWRDLERANARHGGSAHTGHKNSLNTKHLESQGAFSTPKFSANTSNNAPKGNFKLLKDRIRSLVGVAPADNLELPGRVRRTVILSPKKLEKRIKDGWIQKENIISEEQQKDGRIAVTYYPDTRDVGFADFVKSVRQVAKRNPFVKVLYDLAHKAMKKQEKLRNEFGKALKEFNELVKNEKDLKSITAILWQGDAEGRVFSDAELRSLGANERVIKAYRLVRRELEKAYKMLRDAQTQVKTRSQTLAPESVESFKKNHWIEDADVISTTPRADGTVLLTWRGGRTYDVNGKTVTAEALKLMQEDENINVTSAMPVQAALDDFRAHAGRGLYKVNYVERIKPVFRRTGYMPHFFHEWMIYEKIEDPKTGEVRYVSVDSGRTMNEAVKIGNEIAAKNKDKQYVLRPKGFDLGTENAAVIGDMDFAQMSRKLAESTEISLADARSLLLEDAGMSLKSRHRFFGSLLERKDGKGFDQDVQWVLAHYFNSAARYIAMEDFKPAAISMYERFFGRFDDEPKNLTAQYCKNLINDVNGNPRAVEVWLNELIKKTPIGKYVADSFGDRVALALNGELSTWNAIMKLSLFNFASAAVNFSQFINVGAALNDYGYAMKGLKKALHPSAMDEKIIEASGLLDDINMADDNGGYSQRRGGKVRGIYSALKKGGEWTLIPFQKADTLMRKAAVLGAYYQGVEQKGMKTAPGDELSAEALAYAQEINDDANFDYSSANAPGIFRAGSVFTQQLSQFQKYPIMQFEFMYNIMKNGTRGQKVRFFVPYVLFCGIPASIPFGGLLNRIFSDLFGFAAGDDDKDFAQEVKAEVLRWAGKDPVKKAIAETALYGILAPTFGLDISGRIGMSNAFGGEFYGAQKPESVSDMAIQQLGGPALNSVVNFRAQLKQDNPIEALKAISPALGNMAQAAVGESRTTRHRVNARYDSTYDKLVHALGFRSVEESKNAFIMHYEYEQKGKAAQIKREAIQDYIADPSDENRRTINALGITDKQIKEARIQQERTTLERAREGRPKTSNKSGASRQRKEEAKRETLYDTVDEE